MTASARWLAVLVLAGCSAADAWTPVAPPAAQFRAEMPGTPVETSHKTLALPVSTEVHTFEVDRGARGSFQVSFYDLAMGLTAATAADAAHLDCTSALANSVFVPASQHAESLGSAVGFAITAEAPVSATLPDGGFEEQRCFVAGRRMFHAMVVGPNTPDQKQDAARFFASFAITTPPTPG